MEFQILGPLEVRGDRGAVALGGIKPRAVLAVLLLHANEPVSAERLAVALWGEDAPAGATKTVRCTCRGCARRSATRRRSTTTPAGYRLRVRARTSSTPSAFQRGVAAGRLALAAGEPARAVVLLEEALALWRGPPLAELAFEPFAQAEIARPGGAAPGGVGGTGGGRSRRWAACGGGRRAAALLAAHPTREGLAGQLMLALYRSGRQSEALEAYRERP